ncbi:DUF4215 domain-containing protein [Myxococcota bacterium]
MNAVWRAGLVVSIVCGVVSCDRGLTEPREIGENVCGDARRESGEACDDGNAGNGDGCDGSCNVEVGWFCSGDQGQQSTCALHCGDGEIDADQGEECDDGDLDDDDGCDKTCKIEQGWKCSDEPSVCTTECGDGDLAPNEDCDDQNTSINDDCPSGPTGTCEDAFCGDGFLWSQESGTEECDDSDNQSQDGCSAGCQVEHGWSCTGDSPSVCSTTCGDGLKAASEACDDGDTSAGDGCNGSCVIESGWLCEGDAPSVCRTDCGDGVTIAPEECDHGKHCSNGTPCTDSSHCSGSIDNTCRARSGDGCSEVCLDETSACVPNQVGVLSRNTGRVLLDGSTLYGITPAGQNGGDMFVATVANRTTPGIVGDFDDSSGDFDAWHTVSLVKHGNTVWVAGMEPRLMGIDVNSPSTPTRVWSRPNSSYTGHMALAGDFLLVVDQDGEGIAVWNVSNPGTPQSGTPLRGGSGPANWSYNNVGVASNRAYVTGRHYSPTRALFETFDISDMSTPTRTGFWDEEPSVWDVKKVVGTESFVFVAACGDLSGIHVMDVSNPSAPDRIDGATITMGGTSCFEDIALANGFLYVPTQGGLNVYDVSIPSNPRLAAQYPVFEFRGDAIALDAIYAYVSSHPDGGDEVVIIGGLPGMCDPTCGNSATEYPETCDDGNHTNGDGCSSGCELE